MSTQSSLFILARTSSFPPALVFLLIAFSLFFYVVSLRWVCRDAEARGKGGCLIVFLVAVFTWPLGLLFWFAFRPPVRPVKRPRKPSAAPPRNSRPGRPRE